MIGSPLNLEVLLHCYYSTEPHPHYHAPAVRDCISYLADNGMIEWRDGIRRTTEKAEAFINHLLCVPFPVAKWVIPLQSARSLAMADNEEGKAGLPWADQLHDAAMMAERDGNTPS